MSSWEVIRFCGVMWLCTWCLSVFLIFGIAIPTSMRKVSDEEHRSHMVFCVVYALVMALIATVAHLYARGGLVVSP